MSFFQWSIGIYSGTDWRRLVPQSESNPVLSAESVSDLKAKFVADPFMAREGGRWWMFFETMPVEGGRGVIGLASSEDARHWSYHQTVLAEPFHLSYPQVFLWNGEWFMLPETAERRSVRLYRAREFPLRWEFESELISNALLDPTVFHHLGMWWIFASPDNSTLLIYYAEKLQGPWLPHPANPIVKDNAMIARPAGRVITHNGQLFRLGQDSIPFYGTRVRAFAIDELSLSEYCETEIAASSILGATRQPAWNGFGMHHADIHQLEDGTFLACVDGSRLAHEQAPETNSGYGICKACVVATGYDARAACLARRLVADSIQVHVMLIEAADRVDTQIRPARVDGAILHRIKINPSNPQAREITTMVLWALQTGLGIDHFHVLEPSLIEGVRSALGEDSPRIVEEYGA